MKSYKIIPLPHRERIVLVYYESSIIIFKCHYSPIADTVYYTATAEPYVFRVFQEYIPDFWYNLELEGIFKTLELLGFEEIPPTENDLKIYQK